MTPMPLPVGPAPHVVEALAAFFAVDLWPQWRRLTRGAPVSCVVRVVWWPDAADGLPVVGLAVPDESSDESSDAECES